LADQIQLRTAEPVSVSSVQASTIAARLNKIGEVELANEIDDAITIAMRYALM